MKVVSCSKAGMFATLDVFVVTTGPTEGRESTRDGTMFAEGANAADRLAGTAVRDSDGQPCALVATTYCKSVFRAGARELAEDTADIHYFPSRADVRIPVS